MNSQPFISGLIAQERIADLRRDAETHRYLSGRTAPGSTSDGDLRRLARLLRERVVRRSGRPRTVSQHS